MTYPPEDYYNSDEEKRIRKLCIWVMAAWFLGFLFLYAIQS